MNKTILQHIAIFSNVRYIKHKSERDRCNVFMYLWPDLYITLERMKYLTICGFFFNLFLFLLLCLKGKEERKD